MNVSIAFISYNQVKYVRQALDGIFAQQADFDWELVVGDDCSTDGTAQIVAEFAERYPDRMRVLSRPRNIGGIHNLLEVFTACRGEYIAVLEGDDFWTSPDKIRRQAEYLDAHPDCTVCFHPAEVIYEDGRPAHLFPSPPRPERSAISDLLAENFIPTCSLMLRRSAIPIPFPDFLFGLKFLDLAMSVLAADKGYVGQVSRQMATYRVHPSGIWSGEQTDTRALAIIQMMESLDEYLGRRYHAAIRDTVLQLYGGICTLRLSRLQASQAAAMRWVYDFGWFGRLRSRVAMRIMLSIYAPWLLWATRRVRGLPRSPTSAKGAANA